MCSSTSRRSRLRASAASPRAIRSNSRSPRVRRACRRRTSARSDRRGSQLQRVRSSAPGPLRFRALYWAMIPLRGAVLALLLPTHLVAQAAAPAPPYRGFTPGIGYRAFVQQARALADNDVLRCQTSPRTAQIMECAVLIRDPRDGARFYLSAHFIESDADMVALYDSAGFGNARGVTLVDRTKRDLTRVFGRPHVLGAGAWQWRYGRRVVRLSWRGRGTARWVSITLTDGAVMDRISRYVRGVSGKK